MVAILLSGLSRRALLGRLAVLCTPFRAVANSAPAPADLLAERKPELTLPPLAEGWRRLYLCRHGETDWNAQSRIQGATDVELNAKGKRQAEKLAELLADAPIDLVLSSSLSRASATADAVAALHPSSRRLRDSRFNEMCFGSFEGQALEPGSHTRREYDKIVQRWASGDTESAFPGTGGESPSDVASRSMAALRDLGLFPGSDGASKPDCPRHVCLVAHGRHNKILLAALAGNLARCSEYQQGNTCLNVIDIAATDGEANVRLTDYRAHLQGSATDGA
eukprot:scaffold276933_cov37-Tisochrysis_lutea.AAC.1